MLTGAMSDEVFSDDLIPHLDRVVSDIASDPATVGSLKTFTFLAVLPSNEEMNAYIRTPEFQTKYGDDALKGYLYSTYHLAIVDYPVSNSVRCCENERRATVHRLMPEDIFSFLARPLSMGVHIEPNYRLGHFCKDHQLRNEIAPVMKLDILHRDASVPLTLTDTFALTTTHSHVSAFTLEKCTVREIVNAYGISSGHGSGGFNTAYYHHTGKFEEDYQAFSQVAPHGMALSWLMLAGWRGKSSKIVRSRLATIVELSKVMDAREILRYLDAGSKNVREVALFHKAGISHEVVARALALGISNPKMMRTVIDEGIDFALMESLVGSGDMVLT